MSRSKGIVTIFSWLATILYSGAHEILDETRNLENENKSARRTTQSSAVKFDPGKSRLKEHFLINGRVKGVNFHDEDDTEEVNKHVGSIDFQDHVFVTSFNTFNETGNQSDWKYLYNSDDFISTDKTKALHSKISEISSQQDQGKKENVSDSEGLKVYHENNEKSRDDFFIQSTAVGIRLKGQGQQRIFKKRNLKKDIQINTVTDVNSKNVIRRYGNEWNGRKKRR
mmetsp:Transcript_11405/g.21076  ORF Transcript_11405/g.21076 Transcript_11405/m.21076 type:complete len:226 (-) Transcript_11405:11-688(-)